MNQDTYSCDNERKETLECLRYMDGLDSVIAMGNYFSKVDNRSGTNNYEALIRDVTKNCAKMANPRLWVPLNPSTNLDQLVAQIGLNWPSRASHPNETMRVGSGTHLSTSKITQSITQANKVNGKSDKPTCQKNGRSEGEKPAIMSDERLKNLDERIVELVINEIVDKKQDIKWDDIAGLENVKQAINEIVVYPMQNPDLFKGLLAPAKGLLLFGPPGTGKTLIGKCIAAESGATFFSISASSLTSKWIGEGEKMVRALFAVARCLQPSVVFIDEIDSLLTQRVDGEHDSTRRMKTEFLVQFDGVATGADDRLLIVGATNRPHELDEAARRRFTKRLYVPLPDHMARKQIILTLMSKAKSGLTDECVEYIVGRTEGFSGADMANLCREAAMASIKPLIHSKGSARNIGSDDLPSIMREHFDISLGYVKASVSGSDLGKYEEWDLKFGASRTV